MTHKDLDVYKKSILFVKDIYEITKNYPKEEIFGIVSQMRRAAVSIPSNISEGSSRQTDKEFIQFLYISLGSLSELETQLELSQLLGLIDENALRDLNDNLLCIKQMLLGLIKFVKSKS